MTEKGCGDAARNQLQNLFVGSFDKVTLINITATTLTLSSPDNQIVMVFDAE